MIVYRICNSKYPNNDGECARLYGGRWNHKGIPPLYCGSNVSICVLEILVHSAGIPRNHVLIEADLPDTLIEHVDEALLSADWDTSVAGQILTKTIGTQWAVANTSAVIKRERNYLINPLHHDFGRVRFGDPVAFHFDPRLK